MSDADLKVKGIKTTDASGTVINPAKEDGNLATIAGKDFATETTLALVKAKTDNLDTALSGIKTGTDKIITSPATEAKQDDIITKLDDVTISKLVGTISTVNSTTTPLGINGVFTGTADEVLNYVGINISIISDKASATDGLSLQWSPDGTYWDEMVAVTILAGEVWSKEFGIRARYFRIVYTNGVIAQTYFRLQTIFHLARTRIEQKPLNVVLKENEFAPTTRAVISGRKPGGDYTNIQATTAGNLKVSIEEQDPGAGLATEAKQDNIITAINTISGLQISTDMEGGGKNAVGIVAVEVTFTGTTKSIIISADPSNTGELYIGKSNVTSAGANAITFLLPGESVEMSYNDATNAVYVVASVAAQNFYKGALL